MARVAVLYCGSVFTRGLIDKLLRFPGIEPILYPSSTPPESLDLDNTCGIMITGSGEYVNSIGAPKVDQKIYDCGLPILGICYGMQRMAVDLGGKVGKMKTPEHRTHQMELTKAGKQSLLYTPDFIEGEVPVWMAHNCKVYEMPAGFALTGKTKRTEIAAFEHPDRRLYGIQSHPEHMGRDPAAQSGTIILTNFLRNVCHQL